MFSFIPNHHASWGRGAATQWNYLVQSDWNENVHLHSWQYYTGANYVVRLTPCHFTGFYNQINLIRGFKGHFLELLFIKPNKGLHDVNLCFPVECNRSRSATIRSKIRAHNCVFTRCPGSNHYPCLTTQLLYMLWTLFTVKPLCVCHYNLKSWHSMVLLE